MGLLGTLSPDMSGPMFSYIPLWQNRPYVNDGSYAGSYVNDGFYDLFYLKKTYSRWQTSDPQSSRPEMDAFFFYNN